MNFTFTPPDQEFWLVLLICLLGLGFSFYKVRGHVKLRPVLLLRGFLFILLIFLFLDPKFEFVNASSREMNWHLYVDRSLSMSYHSQPSVGSLVSGIDQLVEKIEQKKVPFKIIGFGSDLDTSWTFGEKEIQDGSTDIGQVMDHIRTQENNGLAGSIIITDGQVNLGQEIPSQDLNITSPIHIIGVGDETPLVDVAIHAIDAPPVIIKGENADLDVTITSHGAINERVNITLYSGQKLVGSKVVNVSGDGSLERVRFRINPTQSGEVKYRVQVNALPDEINIQNNKQVVPIQILKNEYAVAMITGAPNFNTQVIKRILSEHPEYRIDHFVYRSSGYSLPLKKFWDTKYDLILFDNHPVEDNAKEWYSLLRIFAKKLISHQSSFAFIAGSDVHETGIEPFLSLMDIAIKDPLIELESVYDWELNSRWNTFFPFHSLNPTTMDMANLPPLSIQFEVDSTHGATLANYFISEVDIPLLLVGEKPPLRFMVWSSPELYKIYYKTNHMELSGLTAQIMNPIFSWLMRTGNGQDFYFRSDKNSYQQGERVTITGKPIQQTETSAEGFIHILSGEKRINSKPIRFDAKTGHYVGQFWASQAGQLDYEVEFKQGNQAVTVSEGSVQVQESQVELNHVYLNKDPLKKLADLSNGTFRPWNERRSLISQINPQTKVENQYSRVVLHDSRWMILLILGLLSAEWLLRRRLGLM